jgi:hypothetical protein
MAITQVWQIERGTLLLGAGTDYDIVTPPGPIGLLGSTVRAADLERMGDGSTGGRDVSAARLVTIPINVHGTDPADTHDAVRALTSAWRRTPEDVTLDVSIPGQPEDVLRYYGRCRGVTESQWTLVQGDVALMLAFTALDPYAYGAEVTSAVDSSSPLTLDDTTTGDPGTTTARATLTIVGNGGTPVITNTTTGGLIAFAGAATGTYVIDLHTQTVTKSGVPRDQDVAASSPFFRIAGGVDNVITFAGCASIQLTYRPAYEVI